MPAQSQEDAHLFAAYLELVADDGVNRRRKQWVVLPQMPARLAPGDSPITPHLSWFQREQRNSKHRAMWSYHVDTDGRFKQNLADVVSFNLAGGWEMSLPEMLTCEIHPTELAQILKERRTPYRILQRLQKVSRSKYRIDIT
jgi:hypothetical protein